MSFRGRMAGIFRAIRQERDRQDAKWGGPDHDDQHGLRDWISFINRYLGRADEEVNRILPFLDHKVEGIGHGPPYPMPLEMGEAVWKYRRALEKTASLAVAAIESLERRLDFTIRGDYQIWYLADTGFGKWVVAAQHKEEAREVVNIESAVLEASDDLPEWDSGSYFSGEFEVVQKATPDKGFIYEGLDESTDPPRPILSAFWDEPYETFPTILQEWRDQ